MRDFSHHDYYLAGVFDGEGCVTVQHGNPRQSARRVNTRLHLSVGMKCRPIVEQFRARFGGGLGCKTEKSGAVIWQWWVCGANAAEALGVFSVLCTEKKEQAALALKLCPLLSAAKARGKRRRGEQILTSDELAFRASIAHQVTALKRQPSYADA